MPIIFVPNAKDHSISRHKTNLTKNKHCYGKSMLCHQERKEMCSQRKMKYLELDNQKDQKQIVAGWIIVYQRITHSTRLMLNSMLFFSTTFFVRHTNIPSLCIAALTNNFKSVVSPSTCPHPQWPTANANTYWPVSHTYVPHNICWASCKWAKFNNYCLLASDEFIWWFDSIDQALDQLLVCGLLRDAISSLLGQPPHCPRPNYLHLLAG